MKLLSQYLYRALKFESFAAAETNPKLKADLEGQASAYRKLAADRAAKLGLPEPSAPWISSSVPSGKEQQMKDRDDGHEALDNGG